MNTIITNLFLIQFIIVNIIDISGFIQEMESMIARWLKVKSVHIPKPFSCSYCLTWWTGLIYLMVTGNLTLIYTAILLMICALSTTTADIIYLLKDIITKIIQTISRIIN